MRVAPTHPGVILAEAFSYEGLSIAAAARRLSVSPAILRRVCRCRRPLSLHECVLVAALTGTSVEFWARLQLHHDLWHAIRRSRKRACAVTPLKVSRL